jgi:deoxyribodipyrimidine photolyase-related protein
MIFPHQLHDDSPVIKKSFPVLLVEEYLFFLQYPFHKQKLAFHRATMQYYRAFLLKRGCEVHMVEARDVFADIRKLIPALAESGVEQVHYIDPTDDWLDSRIRTSAKQADLDLVCHPSQSFLCSRSTISDFFGQRKRFYQKDFYVFQRKRLDILMEGEDRPVGGKWVYDADNRKKYPRDMTPPDFTYPEADPWWPEAVTYVEDHFPGNPGTLDGAAYYPVTHQESQAAMEKFFAKRFGEFGTYQDAIVAKESFLHHSVLSPMINAGLLSPQLVLDACLEYAVDHSIPINSVEGFVRQLIGWREFIRAVYELAGRRERTCNFWDFDRKMPESFWTGETGIAPFDQTIRKVLRTGYCHHIERLMVLGNFMVLCEFDPDEVYRWFMVMFVDAYDWVMVPNVYGMSQFADGGLMSTKPYISSSNYIRKMSDYTSGDWERIWDGLFWRFLHNHRDFFQKNPRMRMLLSTFDRMDDKKRKHHLDAAEEYLLEIS